MPLCFKVLGCCAVYEMEILDKTIADTLGNV